MALPQRGRPVERDERRAGRPKKRLLKVGELAEYLAVSVSVVYRLRRAGLPCFEVRAGTTGGVRFDRDAVMEWLGTRTIAS